MSWWVWILVGVGCMGWMQTTFWLVRHVPRRPRHPEDEDDGMRAEANWFEPPILKRKPPDTGSKGMGTSRK